MINSCLEKSLFLGSNCSKNCPPHGWLWLFLPSNNRDCLSVTQALYPLTSTSETGESSGHPIFISTSATHTMTPVPGATLYSSSSSSSSSSSGSVLVGSEGSKTSIDGRRKRPASNLTTPRQNSELRRCAYFHNTEAEILCLEAGFNRTPIHLKIGQLKTFNVLFHHFKSLFSLENCMLFLS